MGEVTDFSFTEEGNYKVILTVKDDDYLIDRSYKFITVVQRVMSVSKVVDKPIATPGSILTYTLTPTIDPSWRMGVKDIVIQDTLPENLEYVDATPVPDLTDKTLTWRINRAYSTSDLTPIKFEVLIDAKEQNGTIISNYATMDYKGMGDQEFPQELSNLANTKINTDTLLAPSIREPLSNIILKEDAPPYDLHLDLYEYDLQDSGTDLKWHITENNESMYILSGEYSDDDVLTITPLPDAYGNDLVTLWLVDSEGYSVNQPLWINITSINDDPIFMQSPDLIIHYGKPYTFDYFSYISDIDSPMEQWELFAQENTPEEQGKDTTDEHIQIEGFKITYNYPVNYVDKQVHVSLIVYDGDYGSDGDTITIIISDDETPTLIKELPDVSLEEGETKLDVFDLDEYFDYPETDSLFYSLGETQVDITIDNDNSVDISSKSDWYGVDFVTFRATDFQGSIAEDTIAITVMPINDPPEISGVPEVFVVRYEEDYYFELTPYISDKDNDLDELILIITDQNIRVDPANQFRIIMNYPRNLVGQDILVNLVVSDGLDTASAKITIRVTKNWPPQLNQQLPDLSLYEDETLKNALNLTEFFNDKDSNTLYYTYGHEFVEVTIHSNGSVDLSAAKDWHGVELVTFRATDNTNAFVENPIVVTVIPVNDPPTILPIPNQTGKVNEILKFDLTEYIEDIDNDLSDITITVESNKLDVDVNGFELIIYSKKPAIDIITISVSDGLSETSENMFIEITSPVSSASESNIFLSIIWLLILIITIIISIIGYTSYKKYVGSYKLEELFWIYKNGILIFHEGSVIKKSKRGRKKRKAQTDEEIESSMLSAILDFTQEVFTDDPEGKQIWRNKEIQMDGSNILIDRGKYTFLATIFKGKSGKKLYSESRTTLKSLEFRYGSKLKKWKGDTNKLKGAKKIMRTMLPAKDESEAIKKK